MQSNHLKYMETFRTSNFFNLSRGHLYTSRIRARFIIERHTLYNYIII
jgi:hypothetical protein